MPTKHPISSFKHCPVCSTTLQLTRHDHRLRNVCPKCHFVDYHNPTPAAGAVVIRDGKLLLVKRADYPYKGDWCIPAGFMEWDESPQECARRELKEETGLDIAIGRPFNVYSGNDDPRTNAVLVLFFCEIVGGTPTAGDDAAEIAFFGKDEIPDNIAFIAHRQAIRDLLEGYPELLK